MSPPERVVEVGLASTAGLVPDMQLLFRLFSAPHTNQCLGRSQRQLASTPPAAPVEGVLVARGEVPVNVSAVRSVTTPRQPDKDVPMQSNAVVRIWLEQEFAFETGDCITPVASRQPDLVA